MMFRRRFSRRSSSSRDYADKLADAMGEGLGGDDARVYARGCLPLRSLLRRPATATPADVDATAGGDAQ